MWTNIIVSKISLFPRFAWQTKIIAGIIIIVIIIIIIIIVIIIIDTNKQYLSSERVLCTLKLICSVITNIYYLY